MYRIVWDSLNSHGVKCITGSYQSCMSQMTVTHTRVLVIDISFCKHSENI